MTPARHLYCIVPMPHVTMLLTAFTQLRSFSVHNKATLRIQSFSPYLTASSRYTSTRAQLVASRPDRSTSNPRYLLSPPPTHHTICNQQASKLRRSRLHKPYARPRPLPGIRGMIGCIATGCSRMPDYFFLVGSCLLVLVTARRAAPSLSVLHRQLFLLMVHPCDYYVILLMIHN